MPNIALLPYADSRRAVSVRKSDRVRSDSPESIVHWHWMAVTVGPIHNLIVITANLRPKTGPGGAQVPLVGPFNAIPAAGSAPV
jgi:hypothetical protein